MYRTRNSIIHSGDNPYHLTELLEHLHSYVDQCLSMMLISLTFDKNIRSISDFIVGSQLQKDEIVALFDSKLPFTRSDLSTIMKKVDKPESSS